MWKAWDSGCIWGKNNGKYEKGLQVVFDELEKLTLEACSIQARIYL